MSGIKMIKTAGVCEFSSDHTIEAQLVLTVAYLRAHPPNLNSSNHLQLDQVLVLASLQQQVLFSNIIFSKHYDWLNTLPALTFPCT